MIGDLAAMRAWLDAHGLGDAELLHSLPNHGLDGADRLTDLEQLVLSGLLEARRAIVPGYRPAPADWPTTQDRPGPAELLDLFDPGPTRPPQGAVVEPADRRAQRPVRPTARHHGAPPPARRPAHRDREEERER
jgi:hypothetical protein